jgi:hypothetical protein
MLQLAKPSIFHLLISVIVNWFEFSKSTLILFSVKIFVDDFVMYASYDQIIINLFYDQY